MIGKDEYKWVNVCGWVSLIEKEKIEKKAAVGQRVLAAALDDTPEQRA
jgi:hypothetical protein